MSSKKIKKERGITLISLVITIVLLIILATVSINVLLGEGGLINQAKVGGEQYKIEEVRDKLEVAKGEAFIDGKGTIDPDHYFDIIQEDGIIYDKETDVTDKGNSVYEIITVEGYIFKVTLIPSAEDANDMEIEYERKEEGPRIIEIKVVEQTTNSVKIEVETRKAEGAEYTYLYKKNTEGEENWIEAEKSKENEYTYNNLTAGEIYNIKVKVENGKGKTDRTINIQLGEMPKGAITFDEVEWVGDGTAKVRINTSAQGYTMQYQISKTNEEELQEENWKEVTSGSEITDLYHGDTVYARLTDGINESDYASANVMDGMAPTVSISSGTITVNSIQVKVNAIDNESGIASYKYYINNNLKDTLSTNSYTFSGLADNTTYTIKVVVTDKAGNEKESNTITAKTLLNNKAPVISSTSLNSKTTNSITINARGTDANGDKITYELYTSTSSSSGFSRKATSGQTTSGNQVSLTATGLSQYTTYYYYVIAKDEYTQTKGSTSSVRTYCPGKGLTCNGPFSAYVNCNNCNGTGKAKCKGSIEETFSNISRTRNMRFVWGSSEALLSL